MVIDTKEKFIQVVGEHIYNGLNDAVAGKYKGVNRIKIPIDAHYFFKDGNPWLSGLELDIPSFVVVEGSLEKREFRNISLDEYMGWIDKNGD